MNAHDFFKKNIPMKILSVALALILWFYAASSQKVEIRRRVEIRFENLKDSLAVGYLNSDYADILLAGKSRDFLLMNLLKRKVFVSINLSSVEAGEHSFDLSEEVTVIGLLKNIRAEDVLYPKRVEAVIDSLAKRDVIVSPVITGQPSDGYSISGDVLVNPERITITGAKILIDKIASVETDEINIRKAKKSVTKNSAVNLSSSLIKTNAQKVLVTIPVDELVTRDFRGVPVIFINKNESVKINPDSVSVDIQLSGPKRILFDMLAGEVSPVIDISHIRSRGFYNLRIYIPKRKYVEILSVSPAEVKIEAK
ncbi:MAG: CdaR family protein [bacterium]|nr:CdaR family protein [bacterium]